MSSWKPCTKTSTSKSLGFYGESDTFEGESKTYHVPKLASDKNTRRIGDTVGDDNPFDLVAKGILDGRAELRIFSCPSLACLRLIPVSFDTQMSFLLSNSLSWVIQESSMGSMRKTSMEKGEPLVGARGFASEVAKRL